jgi:hypothetical protein
VLHTPLWMIAAAQLFRLLFRVLRFLVRHPVATLVAAGLAWLLVQAGRRPSPVPVPPLALPAVLGQAIDAAVPDEPNTDAGP